MDIQQFEDRKRDHLRYALDPAHQAGGASGLERVRLVHDALPELDWSQVSLESRALGHAVPSPFFVAAMTAGHADAPRLNGVFARACARRGWALGVGSQRRELTDAAAVDRWADLRAELPGLRLYANLGLSQLISTPVAQVVRLVTDMGATALAVHANALQEALQPEGTPSFRGGIEALRRVCAELSVPVILKETGCGFSLRTLEKLSTLRLGAVDVSGLGGTHWGRIEGARASAQGAGWQARAADVFRDWGVPTLESVLSAQQALAGSSIETWASGGVRSGLDAMKWVALGACQVGFAKPALEAALVGEAELEGWMKQIEQEARVALFCTGYATAAKLRGQEKAWTK